MKFTITNFEKFTTGGLFIFITLVTGWKYLRNTTADPNMINLSIGLGGLFIARKAVSYFKPETYYNENPSASERKTLEQKSNY